MREEDRQRLIRTALATESVVMGAMQSAGQRGVLPGEAIQEALDGQREKIVAIIDEVDFPRFTQLKAGAKADASGILDKPTCVRAIRAILRQVKEEYPGADWLLSDGPTDELIIDRFFPGIVVAQGVWCSLSIKISDDAIVIPPVLIGNGCTIQPAAIIGPYSAVCGTEVDEGSWVGLSSLGIDWRP